MKWRWRSRPASELCFDCKSPKTFQRVRRYGSFVYFCRECNERLESGSWLRALGFRFHLGAVSVFVYRSLRKRLRIMLAKQMGKRSPLNWDLKKLAGAAGQTATDVLKRLTSFEGRR